MQVLNEDQVVPLGWEADDSKLCRSGRWQRSGQYMVVTSMKTARRERRRMVMRAIQAPSSGLAQQGRRYSIRLLK